MPPLGVKAHAAYLRGKRHWMKATPEDLDIAEKYFDVAVDKDFSHAPECAGRARVWLIRNQMGFAPPEEAGPKAKAAALRAIELDQNLAGAYDDQRVTAALDEGYTRGGYAEAMKRCAEALASRVPESFALPSDIASFYATAGEREKAIEWLEQGLDLHDPALPYIGVWPAFDDLHPELRFQDLLRRMNLPVEMPVSPPHPTGAAS